MAIESILQFQPWTSSVNVSFWSKYTELRLQVLKLSEDPIALTGRFQSGGGAGSAPLPALFLVDADSFGGSSKTNVPSLYQAAPGTFYSTNTQENFNALDKKALFAATTAQIYADINSGAAVSKPSLLNRFLMLCFADLKTYNFHYWFGFPAIVFTEALKSAPAAPISTLFSSQQLCQLADSYAVLRADAAADACAFWVRTDTGSGSAAAGAAVAVSPLRDPKCPQLAETDGSVMLAVVDPCGQPSHPGWPARNLLALVALRWPRIKSLTLLCYRESRHGGTTDTSGSLMFRVTIDSSCFSPPPPVPQAVGWEKDKEGKLHARLISLAHHMNPATLAESAVGLNLQLMRWRLVPKLDLALIARQRCLLLGAGTLGCNVARALLGWGVRDITLVDSGRVSFSNPVRQSLFAFDDCLQGGKPKAAAAAAQLKAIFPGVNAVGIQMSIPMPGHHVSPAEVEGVRANVNELQRLIAAHDVVFLLTDSRESRWLPTLMCVAQAKLAMTVALGFDTYLVMRHGVPASTAGAVPTGPEAALSAAAAAGVAASSVTGTASEAAAVPAERLGCYFCNDVVAPRDSLSDRTLDQQCTVTRPGLSMIASAVAIELWVSILQHPLGVHAPADESRPITEPASTTELGLLPHQVRGFLTHFSNLLLHGPSYSCCTACSDKVVGTYKDKGYEFLAEVWHNPKYLEDISGVSEMHSVTDSLSQWTMDDDQDDF